MALQERQADQVRQAIIPVLEIQPQRERITNEELGSLIAAIGNHEGKAIVLGLMAPDTIYTPKDASNMTKNAQPAGLKMRIGAFGYMVKSLAPIGLVAQEVTAGDELGTFGFIKTEKGQALGNALAGLLLDFSLRYPEVSLSDLFAGTQSSSKRYDEGSRKRAAATRMKIFRKLTTPSLTTNMVKALGEEVSLIGKHLEDLKEKGVISYTSVRNNEPYGSYILDPNYPKERIPDCCSRRDIDAQSVWDIIQQFPGEKWDSKMLTERYIQRTNTHFSLKAIAIHMQRILHSLASEGYLIQSGFNEGIKASVELTDEKRAMLADLVSILDKFQNQDPETMSFGQSRLKDILSDPSLVSKLLAKAKEHSPRSNFVPVKESLTQILSIVAENPGINSESIREQLSLIQKRKLGKNSINDLLRSLVRSGEISVATEKKLNHYVVVQK